MTTQLHDTGEEFIIDYVYTGGATKPANVDVGLYNDSTDTLADSDDIGAITTEPSGGNYVRQSVSFDGTGFNTSDSGGDWQATNANTVTFDVTNTSATVDSYFVLVNFDSDDAGDAGTAADHLFWTGDLEQSRDLSQIDTLDVNNIGVSLT
jgi:hypothetical protein